MKNIPLTVALRSYIPIVPGHISQSAFGSQKWLCQRNLSAFHIMKISKKMKNSRHLFT